VRGAVLSSHGSSLVPAGMRRILAEVAALRGVELIVLTPAMRNNRSGAASGRSL
jgi:deoxyhypusine synthase